MNLKKSIFSYIVWAAFAVLCCLGIILTLDTAGLRELLNWSYIGIASAACGFLLLTAVVFFALRTLCMEIGEHIKDRERLERAASIVLPVAVLIGIVVYLVLYMLYHVPLTLADDSFYRQAIVSAGKSIPFTVHGASFVYPHLLHVMLLIFGNTPFAGVVLQIILFFVCLLLLYIGMQAFAGVLPAAVSMALLGFLPVSLQFVFSLTPEFFCLAFYLFGFFLIGTLFQKFKRKNSLSPGLYLFAFLSGIYIGFLVYLDLSGVLLFLVLTVLYSLDRDRVKQALGINLTAFFGGAGGFVLSVLFASQIGEMHFSAYLQEFAVLYTQNVHFERELIEAAPLLPDTTLIGSLLSISLAFFVVPAFFIWKRNQNSAFIVSLFSIYLLSVFRVFCLNEQMAATFFWSILAGLGLYGVIRQPQIRDEGEEWTEEELSENEEISPKTDTAKKVLKQKKKVLDEDIIDMDTETKMIEKGEQENPAPGKPLHNPLPVPKKKNRPQVDFGCQVEEADMKFDIEVPENDDFDV